MREVLERRKPIWKSALRLRRIFPMIVSRVDRAFDASPVTVTLMATEGSFSREIHMAKKPATPRQIPDQQEVNYLALFIEAAEELQREPFFGEREGSSASKPGDNRPAHFGNRFQFRSALISFRRIWRKDQPSHFFDICRLIEEFEGSGAGLAAIRDQHQEYALRRWKDFPLSSEQVVEVWLKAVFAETNLKLSKMARWRDRIDFDQLAKGCDAAFLESVCRTTVSAIATCYFHLLKIARPALARWEKDYGLRPEFQIGATDGPPPARAEANAPIVTSKPSTEHVGNETRQQRFERILSREPFKGLKAILATLHSDRAVVSGAVSSASSYQELVTKLGYAFVLTKQIHLQDCYSRLGPAGGIRAALPYHDIASYSTLATVVNFDATVTTTPKSAAFFNERLLELKTQLMD
jgi:hypothetical protein